jgi:perosamine synthetase
VQPVKDVDKKIRSISVPEDTSIREAMQAIDRGGLGLALVVDEDQRMVGIVTDGDLRRALLAGMGLESSVSEVERPTAKTARLGTAAAEIARMFSDPVRVVPLLDADGRVGDLAIFDQRVRVPVTAPHLGEQELLNVTDCILSGWVSSGGHYVSRFEEEFARFCGVRKAIAVCNGTAALHLALAALGVGPGDEVIVPTLTFIATANAVTYTGATPVFVDSEPQTWNLDPARVEEAITPQTRAILVVHLYGQPAQMEAIREIASRHGLAVIEDAAEAHGAKIGERVVGGIGDIGTFSFFGNKIVTTGEGGMVVTDREDLSLLARQLRDHGMSTRRYWHEIIGFNYRMTNLQAAVGVAQLERIDEILAAKRRTSPDLREPAGPRTSSGCTRFSSISTRSKPLAKRRPKNSMSSRSKRGRLSFRSISNRPISQTATFRSPSGYHAAVSAFRVPPT